jgi:hypothetical protein
MRTPLGDHKPPNRRAADLAGFAGTLVDTMLKLEEAAAAGAIHVVGDRRPPGIDRLHQDRANGVKKPHGAFPAEAASCRLGMDTSAKKGFVRINIAYPTEKGLVEQQRLQIRPMTPESGEELVKSDLQGLRSEARHTGGERGGELDGSELTWIVEKQAAPVEANDGMSVFAGLGVQQQATGHAEVEGQVAAAFDLRHHELTVAAQPEPAMAHKAACQSVGIASPQDSQPRELG